MLRRRLEREGQDDGETEEADALIVDIDMDSEKQQSDEEPAAEDKNKQSAQGFEDGGSG